jgi:DNA-binding beta-propeller fold protein YncE
MAPLPSGGIVAFGSFGAGYSEPSSKLKRDFILGIDSYGSRSFIDSSTTGWPLGIISGNFVIRALWLHSLNGTQPIIGGTVYPEGIYLVKFDLVGKVVWVRKQSFHAIPNQITVDRNGMIFVQYSNGQGGFFRKYDSDGNELHCPYPSGLNPRFDEDNNFYLTGFQQLRKFDTAGNLVWTKYASEETRLAVDDSGECYVSNSNGLFNSTISRISTNGNVVWSKTLPIECLANPSIEGDNLYITGNYGVENTIHGIEVLKLDPTNGNILWTTKIPSADYKLAVVASTKGHVYLSAQEWGNYSARVSLIEDLSYTPVTTSLPTQKKTGPLKLVPNPSGGLVRISHSPEEFSKLNIRVFDGSGRLVYSKEVQDFAADSELDLSFLEKGLYIVELKTPGATPQVSRLVIQ